MNRHFFKENIQVTKKNTKRYSALLIIRKTTVRYHLTPVRRTTIKKFTITNAGESVKKREPSFTVGGNVS